MYFTLIVSGYTLSVRGSDFLVISDPAGCGLFDQYEQPLPVQKKKAIASNAPFEIVNERQLMGDQITQAMRLSHMSTVYYLMLDEKGNPSGLPSAASAMRYKGCTPLYDTVTVALPSVKLHQRYPSGGSGIMVGKGETIIRIFTFRGATFLLRPGVPPIFGWSNVQSSAFKVPEKKAVTTVDMFADLHLRIMKRLSDANERYDTLFLFFNSLTHMQKSVPHWNYSTNGKFHSYSLVGSNETISQLEPSTQIILGDIERILLGKPYAVAYRAGIISIGPR